jgi:hypothetical protein
MSATELAEADPHATTIEPEYAGVGRVPRDPRCRGRPQDIGVVADRDAYPDLDVFVAGAREELDALGVSTDPTPTLKEVGA